MKHEPAGGSAPTSYQIIFSCSRTTTALDGPSGGNSPFAKALLNEHKGFFAEGVTLREAIVNVSDALTSLAKDQQAIVVGAPNAIPADFCLQPKKVEILQPTAQGDGAAARLDETPIAVHSNAVDSDLMELLRKWKLGDEKTIALLSQQGVSSFDDLQELEEEDVEKLMSRDLLPLVQGKRLRKLVQHLTAADGGVGEGGG